MNNVIIILIIIKVSFELFIGCSLHRRKKLLLTLRLLWTYFYVCMKFTLLAVDVYIRYEDHIKYRSLVAFVTLSSIFNQRRHIVGYNTTCFVTFFFFINCMLEMSFNLVWAEECLIEIKITAPTRNHHQCIYSLIITSKWEFAIFLQMGQYSQVRCLGFRMKI